MILQKFQAVCELQQKPLSSLGWVDTHPWAGERLGFEVDEQEKNLLIWH